MHKQPPATHSSESSPVKGKRGTAFRWVAGVLVALAISGVAADWWTCMPEDAEATYVGRNTCAECHQAETEHWTGSHHDLAMDDATEDSVLGDFDDQTLNHNGVTSRMFRRDGKFFIHTEGRDGRMRDFQIKYTFGVEPLQQYMVEFPDGRVQVLRVSWDTAKKKWFYLSPPGEQGERIKHDDPLHWTGTGQNWNYMCADCHSTNVEKNYDLAKNAYHTTYSEVDVSCEACHGPGSLHVELARAKSLFWDRRRGYGLARLKSKSNQPQIEACARCHSHRRVICPGYQPGDELLDHYEPARIHAGLYHADGQILDEVYVYGSFVQSKMYRKNVRCTDCHDPHSARLKLKGNKLCAQCHQPGKYDTPAHHFHPVDSAGAQCVECHMPAKTYMEVDPRRDHSLRVPRPDLTVKLGTPNACNNCHREDSEDAQWAADKIVGWYGEKRPDDPHFAPALAAAREGKPEGEKLLLDVLGQKESPKIVQATALELLAQYRSEKSRKARIDSLRAGDPQLRLSAVRSLSGLPVHEQVDLLAPRLQDPVGGVRILAARHLAAAPNVMLEPEEEQALSRSLQEYVESEMANADRAGAHMNLGSLFQEMGDLQRAADAYKKAMRLEPYLAGPRTNLAAIYDPDPEAPPHVQRLKNPEEARRLREQELPLLARDAKLLPDDPLPRYRYSMALYLLGRLEEAEEELEEVCRLAPNSADYRLMLTLLYEKRGKLDEALASLEKLPELGAPRQTIAGLRQRIEQAKQQRRGKR